MLFAFFGLWETTLAVAAGAASIPIIIHLLNRRRYQVVTWAAMRFLLAAQKQNTRRLRLEQLLLMGLRVLLLLLIVLAMASVMPWAEEVWAYMGLEGTGLATVRAGRTHKVLVLDGSLSMAVRTEGGKTAFERARDLARQIVLDSAPGDGFSVAVMKDAPLWAIAEVSQDGPRVAKEIENLKQAHGNASVPAMLNMVVAKLNDTTVRFDRREVYFLTDMQQATWVPGGLSSEPGKEAKNAKEKQVLQEIQKRARTVFVDVGRDVASNLAVTDLHLDNSLINPGALVPVSATVQNFGREAKQNVRVELRVGRARAKAGDPAFALNTVGALTVTVPPGQRVSQSFGYRFREAGTYAVQVRLHQEGHDRADDLEVDNARSVIVTVKDKVPMLLVEGKELAGNPFDKATTMARFMFEIEANKPLAPEVIGASEWHRISDSKLAGYDCIFLCHVPEFGPADVRHLEGHLRRGGGVVFVTGDWETDRARLADTKLTKTRLGDMIEHYNQVLYRNGKGILPAQLLGLQRAPVNHYFYLDAPEQDFREPPLLAFAHDDDRATLRAARFRRYLRAKLAPDGQARQILGFKPALEPPSKQKPVEPKADEKVDEKLPVGDPAVVEWNPPLPRGDKRPDGNKEAGPARSNRYPGKVLLLTSTLNHDWNNWRFSFSYFELPPELVRFALSGRFAARSHVVGQVLEDFPPPGQRILEVAVALPDEPDYGESTKGAHNPTHLTGVERAVEDDYLHWTDTDVAGIYRLCPIARPEGLNLQGARWRCEPPESLFAVNVPVMTPDQKASESDLTRVDKAKLAAAYPGWEFQIVTDLREVQHGGPTNQPTEEGEAAAPGKVGPALAHYALLAVLVLLVLEVVLAWSFGHWSSAAGATTDPPRRGFLVPGLVAGAAGVLFLLGGFTLIHAAATGDFLGFLPDGLRSGLQTTLGIAPAAPGEGIRWILEFQPYLSNARNDLWLAGAIALGSGLLVFFIYCLEGQTASLTYKLLLGSLRVFMILLTLAVLLPQLQLIFQRQGWPDVVILLDTSGSMGEPDHYQDEQTHQAVQVHAEKIKKQLQEQLPQRIETLQARLEEAKKAISRKTDDARSQHEVDDLTARLQAAQTQLAQLNSPAWRPSRVQLAQSLLTGADPGWLRTLLGRRRMKVHIYHLDQAGRALKLADAQGKAGDLTDLSEVAELERTKKAIVALDAEAAESRLGTAVRQVLDYYRGVSLSAVIMLTDGVTTRGETLVQVSEQARQKGVPLIFVGIGDDHEVRDMRLHDLKVEDTVYVNDRVIFECKLTAKGYKDVKVPVVLKVKEAEGKEKELAREMVRVDASGKAMPVQLRHQPTEAGEKLYIIEAEAPKAERGEKGPDSANLRLQRSIFVQQAKTIKVLYVEGSPRYEYRFLKNLLERQLNGEFKRKFRQKNDGKDPKREDLPFRVLLVDSDEEFPAQDETALAEFPINKLELDRYDLVIFGDVDPRSPKLSDQKLRDLADFVEKGGGGFLMIAGSNFSPHAYKSTPLADILPIEPSRATPPEPEERPEGYRPELTPVGRRHPIFRLSPDDAENGDIWQRLAPMYWWSEGYRLRELAEVLAVHPKQKAAEFHEGQDSRHPLVVQQRAGAGRSMFFGFDESWRWRFREDEKHYNQFWIKAVRYLSRSRLARTKLELDRQTAYRQGDPIKVTVSFPDTGPLGEEGPEARPSPETEVLVVVEHTPPAGADGQPGKREVQELRLAKVQGSRSDFEGLQTQTRQGKYRFWLKTPDVSKKQPSGQKPGADAVVILPPGELDQLRMNRQELERAAQATDGRFYTMANASDLLDELPSGTPVKLDTAAPPFVLWNGWPIFLLILGLLGAEWFLRKRKHLL